jgi:hypothetical protein
MNNCELNNKIANLIAPRSKAPVFNYKDWGLLMPLVIEHNIRWQQEKDGRFHAIPVDEDGGVFDFSLISVNENPQRALAECLLKVLEEKSAR